jgi:hypothetical protein
MQDVLRPEVDAGGDFAVCPNLRIGVIRTISMVARFGTARESRFD